MATTIINAVGACAACTLLRLCFAESRKKLVDIRQEHLGFVALVPSIRSSIILELNTALGIIKHESLGDLGRGVSPPLPARCFCGWPQCDAELSQGAHWLSVRRLRINGIVRLAGTSFPCTPRGHSFVHVPFDGTLHEPRTMNWNRSAKPRRPWYKISRVHDGLLLYSNC
ncbi:hypothetical protein EDC04DRAFT_1709577 [Pisolithus marmoratus]|nr:hypothetical protein EDC04DRAFT_1709577 [Pisolithus marmoratus]